VVRVQCGHILTQEECDMVFLLDLRLKEIKGEIIKEKIEFLTSGEN
jgi:hypothetical protein